MADEQIYTRTTRARPMRGCCWPGIWSSRSGRLRRSTASRWIPDGLLDPAITLFSYRASRQRAPASGLIKRLGPDHAEIKSMHTAEAARGRGIGRAMLTHLLGVACARGFRRVSLETGTTAAFSRPGRCTRARVWSRAARCRRPAK